MIAAAAEASRFELAGAAAFGAVIGWYLYYINRYRTDAIRAADLLTTITALGGSAILRLFPASTQLFGAYGTGLFLGFFGYFAVLLFLVWRSPGFTVAWFLDGRGPRLGNDEERPASQRPMEGRSDVLPD
jgi:fatty acid desaturase